MRYNEENWRQVELRSSEIAVKMMPGISLRKERKDKETWDSKYCKKDLLIFLSE